MKFISPPCPVCGKPVPFVKTQWGLGTPFSCDGCESLLVIPKNFWIGSSALMSFLILKDRMNSPLEVSILIAGLAVAVLVMSRLFLIPNKA